MEQLLSWGWDGAVLVAVGLLVLRAIPVAFDAWRSGNLIVGTVKTVGPIVTLAALLYGGWWVMRDAATFIYHDAQRVDLITDARQWTDNGAAAIGDGANDLGSGLSGYVDSFRQEWQTTTPNTESDGQAAPVGESQSTPVGNGVAPVSLTQPQAASGTTAVAQPQPAPTRVVGVHAAQMDTTNLLTPDEIQSAAKQNAALGEQARQAAEESGDPSNLNGNSEMLMFGNGGGGPTASAADQAIQQVTAQTYRVQRGDTLVRISKRFYGTDRYWSTLCTANHIYNCNNVIVGKVLTIPAINN